MNRNVKVAKELLKLAKLIVASDEDEFPEEEIVSELKGFLQDRYIDCMSIDNGNGIEVLCELDDNGNDYCEVYKNGALKKCELNGRPDNHPQWESLARLLFNDFDFLTTIVFTTEDRQFI